MHETKYETRGVLCPLSMAGWAGFSEEELRRMKQQKDSSDSHRRPPSTNKSRQQLQREKALQQQIQKVGKQDGRALVLPEQQLSKTKSRPCPAQSPSPPSAEDQRRKNPDVQQTLHNSVDSVHEKKQDFDAEQNPKVEREEVELPDKSRLDQLHLEQRLMEEKNKRKKALLSKAIAERSKKTQAETVKLRRIQKELQALDDLVSTDICILRNRIEQACIDFSYAKKRFDKAETEYIASKLDLHRKTEIKEQLTEHLCTIIQQNEMRKAKKLEELMQQLEVETDEEKLELEIEVEQMLQRQETEARRQALQSSTVTIQPSAEENLTVPSAAVGNESADKAALTQAAEKPANGSAGNVPNDHVETGPSESTVESAA